MKIVFYDALDLDKQDVDSLFKDHEVVFIDNELEEGNIVADAEIISLFVSSTLSRQAFHHMPKLALIACRSTGFNNVDIEEAKARNIPIATVPTYGSQTVAEYTFGMLLSLTRKLPKAFQDCANGIAVHQELRGIDLAGKTLGVIGTGKIGLNVLIIGKAFGMTLLGTDLYPNDEKAAEIGFSYVPVKELLSSSDVVSIHTPYTPENHHLINETHVKMMKKGSILVNTARGELVDNRAVIHGLLTKRLSGAALDVLEGEALLSAHDELLLLQGRRRTKDALEESLEVDILRKIPNVLITNHNAYNTVEAVERINATTFENIASFIAGTPQNIVKQ